MKNTTVIIRILSSIYFPLLIVFGPMVIQRLTSNPRPITTYNNVYEVSNAGSLLIEYMPTAQFNIRVVAEEIQNSNANIFYLNYYDDDTLVAKYKITILASDASMELVLNTERMNKTTVGVVSYKTGDEIGFLFEQIVGNYPVNPLINVSKLPTQRHYIITFWIQILLFTAVLVFNIRHLRKVYQYNIGQSTIKFKRSEKIKYTAIGLFIPIIGSIFYIMSGTNLYDEYKTIRGHYYIAGTALTILLYILFTGWVFIL